MTDIFMNTLWRALALLMIANTASADSESCMKASCTELEEAVHTELADHFADEIDGFIRDDDRSCEGRNALVSALNSWGFRAVLHGFSIFVALEGDAVEAALGTLGAEVASAGIASTEILAGEYVLEMRDRGEC